MHKVVIKISQNSVVTQTKFPILYICRKLWQLVESRQVYWNENRVQLFYPPCVKQLLDRVYSVSLFIIYFLMLCFYRAMHYSAKRSHVIHLAVCLWRWWIRIT